MESFQFKKEEDLNRYKETVTSRKEKNCCGTRKESCIDCIE
jgi:hypothetical protein